MRKIFTIVLVAFGLMVATNASAQLSFGLKGGLNVTQMSFDSDVLDQSNKTGFFIGPTVKVTLPIVGLGVDLSALYDQRDAKLEADDESETVSQRNINIPLNLRYGFGLGDLGSLYLAAGPQFGFNIGQKSYGDVFKFKDSDLSLNLGAGIALLNHFEIGFTYNMALGKTAEITEEVAETAGKLVTNKVKNNSWQISAAYYF